MVVLRPCAIRRRETIPNKARIHIDAQVTNDAEFEKMLESVDDMGKTGLKERLRTITGIIWNKRKKIAMGRKIRRLKDLEANIHEKNKNMKLEITRKQGEISIYVKQFMGYER